MDYIKRIFNIQELGRRRLEQLDKEQNLDSCLKVAYKECPALVFQYVLKTRELNRKYSREIYSSTIFEYSDKAEKNLDIIDGMYAKYSIDCPRKICKQLPELLKELEELNRIN